MKLVKNKLYLDEIRGIVVRYLGDISDGETVLEIKRNYKDEWFFVRPSNYKEPKLHKHYFAIINNTIANRVFSMSDKETESLKKLSKTKAFAHSL